MLYGAAFMIAMGLGLPIAVLSAAIGQGKAAAAALEGIARQPDAASDIRANLILSLALIESLVIYALLMFFMLYLKFPQVMDLMKSMAGH